MAIIAPFCVSAQTENSKADQFLKSQPSVYFKENKGQVSDQNYQPRPDVLFYGSDGAMNFHMRKDGISYQLTRVDSWKDMDEHLGMLGKGKEGGIRPSKKVPVQQTIYRVDVNWLGSNPEVQTQTGKAIQGVENYYSTVCPNGVLGVRSFENVQFTNLYEGIDLKYYEHDGHLKYDYLVAPGADYKQIKLEYKGATSLSIDKEGNLLIETPLGSLYEPLPLVTQNGNQLEVFWQIKGDVVSFGIENFDPTQAMIIDPLVRVWGTYYGGEGVEYSWACETDTQNNCYISGSTNSSNAIASSGTHLIIFKGINDAFLTKFNSFGARIWGTYYGGSDDDFGAECSLDSFGNIYLCGGTKSLTGIATVASYQPVYGGNDFFGNAFPGDAFLVKFNSFGVRIWSTYFGGTGFDYSWSCSTDLSDNIYMSGTTSSSTSIATIDSHQESFAAGVEDGFLVKFDSQGNRIWSTYYGGDGVDGSYDCKTDILNNVYLTGETWSTSNIATTSSHQSLLNGESDSYLVKFDSNGVRLWGTYYGGSKADGILSCMVDEQGNIYSNGGTWSSDFIATMGSYQPNLKGEADQFIVKMNSNGERIWGTYYGGLGEDLAATDGMIIDAENIYLVGETNSLDGISTTDGFITSNTLLGDPRNGYFSNFTTDGAFVYGTYISDNATSGIYGIAKNGNEIYVCGHSWGPLSAVTPDSYQPILSGIQSDAILIKFTPDCNLFHPVINSLDQSICPGDSVVLNTPDIGQEYHWSNGGFENQTIVFETGLYYVTISDSLGCGRSDTLSVIVLSNPNLLIVGNATFDYGSSTQLFASGGETYSWQPPTGLSCIDCPNPIVQPDVPTQYTVTVTDSNGCVNTKTVFVNIETEGCIYIPNIFSPNKDAQNDEFCLYGSCLKSGTFTIYNRWGDKVFETTDMKQCWDGTFKGEPVSSDVFVYKLNGVLVTGEVVEESGNIEVVR